MATKVKILTKPITGGRDTIYLDYYPPIKHPETGKPTRREFLKIFLYATEQREEQEYTDANGKAQKRIVPVLDSKYKAKKAVLTTLQKNHNKETMAIAENIKAQRQLEIQAGQMGFLSKEKLNTNFVDYFKSLASKRRGSNYSNWLSAYLTFERFSGGTVKVSDMNVAYANEYREHLMGLSGLKQNTKVSYFGKFKAALRQAHKDGLLLEDLNKRIDALTEEETRREYLTLDELKRVAGAECEIPELKTAALFSAYTGLRRCDIVSLTWKQIQRDNNGWIINFTQQKTGGVEYLPISDEAVELLGERGEADKLIFEALTHESPDYYNRRLKVWVQSAGIMKAITFHCFRHTCATILLSKGTDIYTVSKMLGHRSVKTTQIYTKVVDELKREAANSITLK